MYVKIHPDKKPPSVNLQEDLICINLPMRYFNFFIVLLFKYSIKMNIGIYHGMGKGKKGSKKRAEI